VTTRAPESDAPSRGALAVLFIGGSEQSTLRLEACLRRRGYPPRSARDLSEALELVTTAQPRVVVFVLPMSSTTGREAVTRLRSVDPGVPFLVIGVDDTLTAAGEAYELGAHEHLIEPVHDDADFLATIGVVLGSRRGDRHLQYLRQKEVPAGGWQSVIGESPALTKVLDVLKQVCSRSFSGGTPTILLGGETGTGKGFVAKCIHYNGVRRSRPFVEVNCAALPPSLMESELFGHERGSFTDAKASRAGLFETADGGTIFLDEIGAVPLDLQAKLLTAIEEKTVRRIGSRQSTKVDVQVISATHEDLRQRSRDRTFREDLFHRLNVIAVKMPALRERGPDVVLLAESFLKSLCREYGMPERRLAGDAVTWLQAYTWPGNVRELRNMIERIVLLEDDEMVRASHFGAVGDSVVRIRPATPASGMTLRISLPPSGVPLDELEREVIKESLARCEGNVSHAARYLSITRQTLIYRMKKYRLS
jgi:DNA-binding NtrC family response regulator